MTSIANAMIVCTSYPPGNNTVLIVVVVFFWCVFCFYILNADKTTLNFIFVYVFAVLIVIKQN